MLLIGKKMWEWVSVQEPTPRPSGYSQVLKGLRKGVSESDYPVLRYGA